ncbi:MAG: ABC transporter ATP-binding protein, partial [Nanoarchaeota archaeon]|nr:ABC transporter ATP-binding protein [Nanoarchaeota archaeon]
MEFIQLKGVSKSFKGNAILDDINLTIEEGDIFGVIGQSGSGKTTFLNLIAGFTAPTDGEVLYWSKVDHKPKNLTKNLSKIKSYIGFNPQHTSFYPKLTVKENLLHFGRMYNLKKETVYANAKNLLEFTHLYPHRNKLADELSGGMQKRLDLSCSLVHKPKFLILDEPTSDLDFILQEEIAHLIKEVNKQGVTIVIASHQLEFLEKICDKIAIVHQGKLKSYGNLSHVQKPFLKDDVVINIKVKGKEDK